MNCFTKKKHIHTVITGMFCSLDRCSTTFFTMVEMVDGGELLKGTTVVGAMVMGLMVVLLAVLVVLVTIFTTCSATSFTRLPSPAVMLKAGLALTTEEMTGAVELSSTPS